MNGQAAVVVDVWADVRCPWCWVGHRRLLRAIESVGARVEVRYRSFLLDPRGSVGARDTVGAIAVSEWGMTEEAWERRRRHIEAAGHAEELTIRIDTARTIDSRPAHQVLKLAAERGLDQGNAWETMFAAHLEHNLNLEDWEQLADVGTSIGLDRDEVLALDRTDRYLSEVTADHQAAHEVRVRSVPTVRHDDRLLSGARSVADLIEFLRSASGLGVSR